MPDIYKNDQMTVNYEVYEDRNSYLGITETTLPTIGFLTQEINGAGIAGAIEAVAPAYLNAMSITFNFRQTTSRTLGLAEPKRHHLTLRAANQYEDPIAAKLGVEAVKHVLECVPKTFNAGSLTPGNPNNGSVEMAVRYWAIYADGKKLVELDPLNNKCYINGTDYAEAVRKAMGKQ